MFPRPLNRSPGAPERTASCSATAAFVGIRCCSPSARGRCSRCSARRSRALTRQIRATPVGSRTPLAHHPHTTHNPPPRSTDAARTAAPRGLRAIPTRHHDLPQEGAPPAAPPRRRNAKRCRPRQAEAARLRKPTLLVCRRFGPERPVPASCAARPKGAVGATVSLQMIASCPDVAGGGQPSGPSCVVKVSGR